MILRKRTFRVVWVGVLGLLGSASAVATTARAQTIVVTAKSVKDLAGDFEYLVKAAAPEGMDVQAAVDGLKQLQSGELIKGLDQSRGFGLAVTLPKDFPQGGPPSVVVAVPVKDLGQFLESLGGLGLAVDDKPGVEGFSHKVSGSDGGPTLFVLQAKGYALFSMVPDGAEKLKEIDPASWSAKARPGALVSARVQLSEIPQALKDQVLNQMEAQAQQQDERRPGEAEAQFRGRIAGQRVAMDAMKSLVRDGDAVTLELDLDRKAEELALDLSLTARPGSDMAKALRSFQGRRSRFEDMVKDASVAFWACFPMAKELRDGISQGLDPVLKVDAPGLSSPEKRKLFNRFMELVKANLSAPELDYGIAFGRPSTGGNRAPHFSMVFGMKVQDGRAFEKLVRDAIAEDKPEKGVKVEFDVAKAADGTAIHRMSGPFDEKDKTEANMVKVFGKASLSFAFREDAILAAFGEDSLTPLRSAIEQLSAPRPPGPGPGVPVAVVARVADLGELADEEGEREKFRRAAAETFRGEAAKHDRLSLILKGEGDGIRLRMAVDLPAIKLLASMGKSMQK